MSTKTFTFDPDSGVAYGANLAIYGNATWATHLEVKDTSNSNFDFTGWSGKAALKKSAGIGATTAKTDLTIGFTSAYDGKIKISLTSTQTGLVTEGRYVYNVLVSSGVGTVYPLVDGNIIVHPTIAPSP